MFVLVVRGQGLMGVRLHDGLQGYGSRVHNLGFVVLSSDSLLTHIMLRKTFSDFGPRRLKTTNLICSSDS